MRITEFLVVIVAALLFLVPTMRKEQISGQIQAQEESPEEAQVGSYDTFKIVYKVINPRDEALADIIWMKRAAAVARREGVPYFNVLEQNTTKHFVRAADRQLPVIEGVIELDPDPMKAEFDAKEIEGLTLTETP